METLLDGPLRGATGKIKDNGARGALGALGTALLGTVPIGVDGMPAWFAEAE